VVGNYLTAVILQRSVSDEQGCCHRGGQLLQAKSSNIEEAISELMSMLLVQPEETKGRHLLLLLAALSTRQIARIALTEASVSV